jgi:NADPH-dependent 2,4-dienoyl-CoA reductase/sulfur reductase-like enzyme/rhodanese-related sulfurtransferase
MSKRILIIGGVAGGASAAARARRLDEKSEIILVERGEYVSFANCGLPYFIGGEVAQRDALILRTPKALKAQLNLDVRTRTEATAIDTAAKTVALRNLETGEESVESYDALILAPGATPVRPPIPGADLPEVHTLRDIPDVDALAAAADGAKKAVVIGGGFIGLEMTENLRKRGIEVALAEQLKQVLSPLDPEMAVYLHDELEEKGVQLHLGDGVASIGRREGGGVEVVLSSGARLDGDFALLAVGVRPEVDLARRAGIAIGKRGGIVVDDRMRTSAPDVYAVGDAVEVRDFVTGKETLIPLAGPANRQGRVAAGAIFGRDTTYEGTQGTLIVRVFSQVAAATGANEKTLQAAGVPYEKIYLHHPSHVAYYPGSAMMAMKVLFSPRTGALLGAQIVGKDGVDRRIDVLATALRLGATVYQLEDLELAYAPPFGAAKDPVNHAGFAAANVLRGDVVLAHWHELRDGLDPARQILLDVRNPDEVEKGAMPNALHIPLPQLRARLREVPRDREIIVTCASGVRSYMACRILKQNGYDKVRNLSGGYRTWSVARRAT